MLERWRFCIELPVRSYNRQSARTTASPLVQPPVRSYNRQSARTTASPLVQRRRTSGSEKSKTEGFSSTEPGLEALDCEQALVCVELAECGWSSGGVAFSRPWFRARAVAWRAALSWVTFVEILIPSSFSTEFDTGLDGDEEPRSSSGSHRPGGYRHRQRGVFDERQRACP
jgi:hypothetical protein